ncbi:hypothetical protein BpHYR1_046286 [Brachionus plicatilis]|uniref:Uncharacterized protein n=1 Tax=Brachionus plicatilis TaxID=10195 RepID=A0A3M7RY70_BRAPC|nr:hypothetical protein BpHYR1_046286 [Brachionus plicatilis]
MNIPKITELNTSLHLTKLSKSISEKKWIVITSISAPTHQCKQLSEIKPFKLLVVGDKKTPLDWNLTNVIYLSILDQKLLGLKTFSTTPFNSYTRKNVGYLYAIKNGAKFIYDTDDDNVPTVNLDQYFNFEDYEHGLVYDCSVSERIINPYSHFGQPQIWPRGYPLNEIKNVYNNSYYSGLKKTSIVQQGVVNGDPDVDAIFRLTKSMKYRKIDLEFDSTSPSFQVPLYKMSPYNSQNTLISYSGFWSLYLPHSVEFRLTDIWRSYWAQRLMWLINETLSFNGPNARQIRNAHNYMSDFEQEKSMYSKTERLVEFLFKWKCEHSRFFSCMIQLTSDMAREEFWQKSEIKSMENWIDDLVSIGYKEPKIVHFENKESREKKCDHKKGDFKFTKIRYSPNFQASIDGLNFGPQSKDVLTKLEFFQNFCSNFGVMLNNSKITSSPKKFNITILVTFNRVPIEKNIFFLDMLYGSNFQNVIFCGSNLLDKLSSFRGSSKKFDSFTFIEMVNFGIGEYHYFCASKAIEMGLKTDGILLLSDDVLIKFWNLKVLDPTRVWFPYDLKLDIEMRENLATRWYHWSNVRENKKDLKNNSNLDESKMIEDFLKQIEHNQKVIGNITKIKYSRSDLFYLPNSKFKSAYYFLNKFREFGIFLELAVPIVLAGIEQNQKVQIINGYYEKRKIPLQFHKIYSKIEFFHPFKLNY